VFHRLGRPSPSSIELATEMDDLDELRRLAARGHTSAAEQLAELTAE
jgi:hypothetical protein